MALSSFTAKGKAADGRPYRVEWNGGGTEVQPIMPFLLIEGGEDDDLGLDPIWPRSLRLFLKDVDLEPLFGLGERAVPAEVYDVAGTDTLVYKGFMATNFYSDVPWSSTDAVELRALDGLGTLENDSLEDLPFSGNDYVPLTEAIARILGSLYGLEVEFGAHWYPDAGGALTADDCPLAQVGVEPNNYREDRPGGDWWAQLEVLKDICKEQGLVVKQVERMGGARWLVAQRDAYQSDGSLKVWRYDTTGTELVGQPVTLDQKKSFAFGGFDFVDEGGRDFVRRRQVVEVTHDFVGIENLISEGGFEDSGADWSITNGSTTHTDASVIDHDLAAPTPESAQDDQKVLELSAPVNNPNEWPISQSLGAVGEPIRTAIGRLKFTTWLRFKPEKDDDITRFAPRLSVGGQYLTGFTSDVRAGVLKGDGELPVASIDRSIPSGTKVPISRKPVDVNSGNPISPEGFITLSERAERGDDVLRGDISVDVEEAWQIRYAGFVSTTASFPYYLFLESPTTWGTYEARFPFRDDAGDVLSGDIMLELGGGHESFTDDVPDVFAYCDDVLFSVEGPSGKLDEITTQASVPELGENEAQTVRTSSGPTTQNLGRLKGQDPNGNAFEPTDWGIGPQHGNDLSLAELKARQRLRYWSNHNPQLTLQSWREAQHLVGDELLDVDGTLYTVHSITYDAEQGGAQVTLIKWADRGIANITLRTVLEQSGSATAGGTGSVAAGEGGTSGDGTTHFVSPTEPQDMDDGDIWLKVPSQ